MSSPTTPRAPQNGVDFSTVSLSERPDLADQHDRTGGSAWPEFMLHDPVALANWHKITSYFSSDQLSILVEGDIAAVINTVPLQIDPRLNMLPQRGVDWGVEKAVADHEAGRHPNALMGLQVVVARSFRGQGFSEIATLELIAHARRRGLPRVLLPVRPSEKHAYPLIPMERYIAWTNDKGEPFDGWLRVHQRLGAKTLNVCTQSMIIEGTVDEWEDWTGQTFPGSGQYIVPFALNPIEIDVEQNRGRYVEPNVWLVHNAATQSD